MEETIKHWATTITDEAIELFGTENIISGGWSPSGNFHIGNAREAITCNAFLKQLRNKNSSGTIKFIIDNTDPLDKIPTVFKKYTKQLKPYLGHPINTVPDPTGEASNYADHFANDLKKAAKSWNLEIDFVYAADLYNQGMYDEYLKKYIAKLDEVQSIMEEVSGSPLNEIISITCENCGNAKTTRTIDITNLHEIHYECQTKERYIGCGHKGTIDYENHQWKLKWRLDWPARQDFLGVTIEPAGKDHSVEGGSIDSSIEVHKRIFNREPPIMPRYGFITINGKKLSGSKESGIPAVDLENFMPPEVYLFLIYRSGLRKDVDFHPASPKFIEIMDEFMQGRRALHGYEVPGTERHINKIKTAAYLALSEEQIKEIPANVSFGEIILLYQTNLMNSEKTIQQLRKNGKFASEESEIELNRRIDYAAKWLKRFAPNNMKFKILSSPKADIMKYWNHDILEVWKQAAAIIDTNTTKEELMQVLRDTGTSLNVSPKQFFNAFYQLFIGASVGPNAPQLTLSLGKERLMKSLQQIEKALNK